MKRFLKKLAIRIPPIKHILRERDELRESLEKSTWRPARHFSSPIPSIAEVRENDEKIFRVPRRIPGIDLNEEEQLQFFEAFKEYYNELPFKNSSH